MKLPLLQEIAYPEGGAVPLALADDGRSPLLESAARTADTGRYSFLAWEPYWTLRWDFGRGWSSEHGPSAQSLPPDPWEGLEVLLAACPYDPAPELPFSGGAIGYFGYELAATLEGVSALAHRPTRVPAARWAMADVVFVLDHDRRRTLALSHGWPETGAARPRRARARLEAACAAWQRALDGSASPVQTEPADLPLVSLAEARADGLTASLSAPEYHSRFARLRNYLEEGHIYQANLSLAFRAECTVSPIALYEALRRHNAAPYAGFLPGREAAVLSASPELFLRRRAAQLVTRPIKGTRPRGATAEDDARLAAELCASTKDHAEHVMIVDVHRNDLGRVARYGTVRVPEPWALESFASVHHLTSTVEAELVPGGRPLDAVRAAFPAGSITGAPKIRAMEILAELEPHARGPYTGALGWIAPDGDFELAVGIRTLTVSPTHVEFPAGGGIVLDSTAEAEYEEAWQKARAVWACVRRVRSAARNAVPAGGEAAAAALAPTPPVTAAP